MKQLIHTYIYQVGLFKFRLLARTLHNSPFIFAMGWQYSISWWVILVLSPSKHKYSIHLQPHPLAKQHYVFLCMVALCVCQGHSADDHMHFMSNFICQQRIRTNILTWTFYHLTVWIWLSEEKSILKYEFLVIAFVSRQ